MRNHLLHQLFGKEPRVCPWWCCFTFDNPLRKLIHNPFAVLSPYVRAGFNVIDIGPGMGYFTIELCRLVGKEGRVIAVDVQEKMLSAVLRRARKAGVAEALETRLTRQESLDVTEKADFVLAFWMVHEVPDQSRFLKDIAALLKPSGRFLFAEPVFHVTKKAFDESVRKAVGAGLVAEPPPRISLSRSALFSPTQKTDG